MASQISHLPHITNVTAGMGRYDPIHNSIFEVLFTPPANTVLQEVYNAIGQTNGSNILSEQVVSVSGLDGLQRIPAAGSQKFFGVDVSFLNPTLEQTYTEFVITFNLNLRNVTDAYVLKFFKQWGKLSYNIRTGKRALKADYVCETLRINQANRDGTIWREVIFRDVFIVNMSNLDALDYTSSEAQTLQVTFRADYWDEKIDDMEMVDDII